MKQYLLYIVLLGSIFGMQGACTNPDLTRQIIVDNLCTLTACSLELTTQLNDLNSTLTSCCADIQRNFDGTFTVISDIKETLTGCCLTLKNSLTALATTITTDLSEIFTTVQSLNLCEATAITTPTTISTSGAYCLGSDINGSIAINASYVVLDLNGREISGSTYGIDIAASSVGVTVKNGRIKNMIDQGIIAHSNCNQIMLENIEAINCGTSNSSTSWGIELDGSSNCILRNCVVSNGFQGILINNSTEVSLNNCFVLSCTQFDATDGIGFMLSGTDIEASNCSLIEFANTVSAATGWKSSGKNHVISECSATNITGSEGATGYELSSLTNAVIRNFNTQSVSATGSVRVGIGFYFTSPCANCYLQRCVAQDISGTDSAIGFFSLHLTTGSSNCVLFQCTAMGINSGSGTDGAFGFSMPACTNCLIYQCLATNVNGTPSVGISDTYGGLYGTDNLFLECFAGDISNTGFESAGSTNQFINNTSSGNPTDYSGVSYVVARGSSATVGNNVSA